MGHEVGGWGVGGRSMTGKRSVSAEGPQMARVGGICRLSLWTRMGMRRRKQRGLWRVWETGEEPVRDEEGCHWVPGSSVLSWPRVWGAVGVRRGGASPQCPPLVPFLSTQSTCTRPSICRRVR